MLLWGFLTVWLDIPMTIELQTLPNSWNYYFYHPQNCTWDSEHENARVSCALALWRSCDEAEEETWQPLLMGFGNSWDSIRRPSSSIEPYSDLRSNSWKSTERTRPKCPCLKRCVRWHTVTPFTNRYCRHSQFKYTSTQAMILDLRNRGHSSKDPGDEGLLAMVSYR